MIAWIAVFVGFLFGLCFLAAVTQISARCRTFGPFPATEREVVDALRQREHAEDPGI